MPTFQDARDGLDALLKDGKGNLTQPNKDTHLKMAARTFQSRFPRILSVEVAGDGGFEYLLPDGFVDGFSSFIDIYYPWDSTTQAPTPLDSKDYTIWDGPSGKRLRFVSDVPQSGEQFLVQFTAPHNVGDPADSTLDLLDANTVLSDSGFSDAVDVEVASDIQVYVNISAMAGSSLDIVMQTSSDDGVIWDDLGAFDPIIATGNYVLPLPAFMVGLKVRFRYTCTGGTFTVSSALVAYEDPGFTIPDHALDAYLYLAASISAQALADFYAHLMDSQLTSDNTDYEGKSSFWQSNADAWEKKWEEARDVKAKPRRRLNGGQGEWDLSGRTGWSYLTHRRSDR